MDALERVKYVLAQLPREDQVSIAEFLNVLVLTGAEAEALLEDGGVVATVRARSREGSAPREPTVTYRLERVKCGKKGCTKCPHGPYLYRYFREGGRLRKRYAGKPTPVSSEGEASLAKVDAASR